MSRTPRVLVVDDDKVIATSLAMILTKSGFEAQAVFSGTRAIELAHERHFDALVTDVVMQPMDGVRTAIAFRNINPAVHVFLITGTPEIARELMQCADAAWDFNVFSKPVKPGELVDALRSVLVSESKQSSSSARARENENSDTGSNSQRI